MKEHLNAPLPIKMSMIVCVKNRLHECEKEKGELRTELDLFKENFEVEKVNWLDEKEKVIR